MAKIEIKNVKKEYENSRAVKNLTATIEDGEIFGIAGPNGAGKTTTLKMLAGLITPTEGEIIIDQMNYREDAAAIKEEIGYLPEENTLYENMRPRQYLHFFADLYSIPREIAEERITQLFDALKLKPGKKKNGELSKGMQRKVAIARALIHDPEILILDELTSGLDPATSKYLTEYIKDLAGEKTIIFSAHNLYQVESICDRLLIMKDGETITQGTLNEIKREYERTRYTINYRTREKPPIEEREEDNETYRRTTRSIEELESILKWITQKNATINEIHTREETLEDVFLKLIEER